MQARAYERMHVHATLLLSIIQSRVVFPCPSELALITQFLNQEADDNVNVIRFVDVDRAFDGNCCSVSLGVNWVASLVDKSQRRTVFSDFSSFSTFLSFFCRTVCFESLSIPVRWQTISFDSGYAGRWQAPIRTTRERVDHRSLPSARLTERILAEILDSGSFSFIAIGTRTKQLAAKLRIEFGDGQTAAVKELHELMLY